MTLISPIKSPGVTGSASEAHIHIGVTGPGVAQVLIVGTATQLVPFHSYVQGQQQSAELEPDDESDELDGLESDELDGLESDELDGLESDELDGLESDELDWLESDELDELESDELEEDELDDDELDDDELDDDELDGDELLDSELDEELDELLELEQQQFHHAIPIPPPGSP